MSTPNSPYGAPYGAAPSNPQNPYGQDPYAQPGANPYGTQPQSDPYVQPGATPYGAQPGVGASYGDQYGAPAQAPYDQPYGAQPQSNPYAQPYGAQPQAPGAYAQSPYGAPQPGVPAYPAAMAPESKTNTMAIVSLICAFFFSPAGLVCGIVALNQIKRTREGGRGLAIAGVIISAVSILIAVLSIIFVFAAASTAVSDTYDYANSYGDSGYSYEYSDPDTTQVAWLVRE